LAINDGARKSLTYGPAQVAVLDDVACQSARRTISGWPGYEATPLVALPGLARDLGVGAIHYKDEAGRFGLGSFKALGGAYAVARLIAREVARRAGDETVTPDRILAGDYREIASSITVCCATDGNHGRSVAWAHGPSAASV